MHQWYLSYDGKQIGPLDLAAARAQCAINQNGLCWRQGYAEWLPIHQSGELLETSTMPAAPPVPRSRLADEIDYKIFGEDMQYVEIELDPGESAVAEAGSMMFKESAVRMDTVFGDGSKQQSGGFFDKLVGAGQAIVDWRKLVRDSFYARGTIRQSESWFCGARTLEQLFLCTFRTLAVRIICQKDSFLCAAKGVQIGIYFQRRSLPVCSAVKVSSCRSSKATG